MTALPTSTPTPFASHASRYHAAGWAGVLPIPPRQKSSPPSGFTGDSGAYPTEVQLDAWTTKGPACNIALRMNADTVGIDVDNYDGKPGGATLADLVNECGTLPTTWVSTSRTDGVSGIRFYRLTTPTKLIGALPGIEIIQRHHRYAVVAPSLHPDGREYRWISPDGEVVDQVPAVDGLPELPAAWLAKLRADTTTSTERRRLATGHDVAPAVDRAYGQAVRGLAEGTRHDSALAGATTLVRLDTLGFPGAADTLERLRHDFLRAVGDSRSATEAEKEWQRIIDGAVKVVGTTPSTTPPWEDRASGAGHVDALLGATVRRAAGGPSLTVVAPWPTPTPLPPPEPGPAFPLHTLPTWAQPHAAAVADQVQVPVDLAAMQILGALSAACTGRANVHVSPNWSEPVNLYLAVAMRSGAGKSPSDKLVVDWLRTWQRDRMEQMADAHAKAALKVRHARKRLAKLEGSEAVDDHELFKAYEALAMAENDVPPLPRLLADDTSPEAVAGLLREHGQRLAILSTEADLFDMLLRGKPGQRANMNLFLKAWSGDSFTRDRKGGSESGPEWTELSRPLLTIACSVQPSVLAQVRNDPEMTNRGLAARFMVSVPDDVIGHRDVTRRFTATRLPTTDLYETEATRLATRWCTWSNPANLHFTPAASDALCVFLAEIEPRLAKGADLEHLAEWANKLHGSIARYAGLLHLAENGDPQANIEADTVARAIELGRYWMAHAAVVETLTDERAIDRAEGLLAWIAEQGAGAVTLADMQAGHRRPGEGLNKIADYIAPVELLIDLGYLRPVDNGDWRSEVGVRGSKSPNFAVWPEIIGKPRSAVIPRGPRTASMGERDLSSSPYTPPPSLEPRGTRIARNSDEPPAPVDNPTDDQRPDQRPAAGGSAGAAALTADDCLFLPHASTTAPTTVHTDQD